MDMTSCDGGRLGDQNTIVYLEFYIRFRSATPMDEQEIPKILQFDHFEAILPESEVCCRGDESRMNRDGRQGLRVIPSS